MITIVLEPVTKPDAADTTDPRLSALTLLLDTPLPTLNIDSPSVEVTTTLNRGASTSAPSLDKQHQSDMTPYIAQAALLPGEGASVVLRVEVLPTGEPGRVEVDVSSGSRQVDQAAVDYARSQRWIAGRIDGVPQPMWIRWGVQFQA